MTQELSGDARRELARSLAHTLRLALIDKVPGVYMAGLSLLRAVTTPGVVSPRDCASLVADLAPLLIDKVLIPPKYTFGIRTVPSIVSPAHFCLSWCPGPAHIICLLDPCCSDRMHIGDRGQACCFGHPVVVWLIAGV